MGKKRQLIFGEKGQALVEMALILPIMVMLIFGVTEFGRIFSTHLILSNCAREGVRQAAVGATDTEIALKIQDSKAFLDFSKMSIYISPGDSARARGDSVTIQLQYPVEIYAPLISNIVGDPYIANGQATMRVE